MSEPRRSSKAKASKARASGTQGKSDPVPESGRENPDRRALEEVFPGRGGTRKGFVAPNEIEDMSLFDEDPGKAGREEAAAQPEFPGRGETASWDNEEAHTPETERRENALLDEVLSRVDFPARKEDILAAIVLWEMHSHALGGKLRDRVRRLEKPAFQSREDFLEALQAESKRHGGVAGR